MTGVPGVSYDTVHRQCSARVVLRHPTALTNTALCPPMERAGSPTESPKNVVRLGVGGASSQFKGSVAVASVASNPHRQTAR